MRAYVGLGSNLGDREPLIRRAAELLGASRLSTILQTGLTVVGWVSLWRPMEIFLYDWWPLAGDRRLFRRLAEMPVRVRCDPA